MNQYLMKLSNDLPDRIWISENDYDNAVFFFSEETASEWLAKHPEMPKAIEEYIDTWEWVDILINKACGNYRVVRKCGSNFLETTNNWVKI